MKKFIFLAAFAVGSLMMASCTEDGISGDNVNTSADDTGGQVILPPPPPVPPLPPRHP